MSFALDSFVSFSSDFLTSIVDRWTTPVTCCFTTLRSGWFFYRMARKCGFLGAEKNWATTVTKKCGKNCKTKNFLKRKTHTHTPIAPLKSSLLTWINLESQNWSLDLFWPKKCKSAWWFQPIWRMWTSILGSSSQFLGMKKMKPTT